MKLNAYAVSSNGLWVVRISQQNISLYGISINGKSGKYFLTKCLAVGGKVDQLSFKRSVANLLETHKKTTWKRVTTFHASLFYSKFDKFGHIIYISGEATKCVNYHKKISLRETRRYFIPKDVLNGITQSNINIHVFILFYKYFNLYYIILYNNIIIETSAITIVLKDGRFWNDQTSKKIIVLKGYYFP